MKTLLHICCAPCSIIPISVLRDEGHEVTGFFYNPNIHPYGEWSRRLEALRAYAEREGFGLRVLPEYDLEEFLRNTIINPQTPARCAVCYSMRLRRAAREAALAGAQAFSTTLLVSPYQQHDMIKAIGEKAGEEHGVKFLYYDLRPRFREGMARARSLGIYTQQYCGCIYSERDRFERKPDRPRR